MADVNEALTRKVADLARLSLTDQEVTTFTGQLSQILGYVAKLGEANVEGVEPITQPFEMETALRADEVVPFGKQQNGSPKVLSAAPEVLDDGYKVPQIL